MTIYDLKIAQLSSNSTTKTKTNLTFEAHCYQEDLTVKKVVLR